MRWVVGFSNPLVRVKDFFSFIPEFVVQACLAYQCGRKKKVVSAIEDSLLVPPLSSQTGVVVIFQSKFRTFPSMFHVSTQTNCKPWSLTLKECPGCQTNLYLEGYTDQNSLSCKVSCLGCGSQGVVNRPDSWSLFWASLGKKRDGFWVGTLPDPGPLSIDWKSKKGRNTIGKRVGNVQGIMAVWFLFSSCSSSPTHPFPQ